MKKVLLLQGLPASGKSTFAKDLVKKDATWKRINKDDLRAMLHDKKFSREKEKHILQVRDLLIMHFINGGFNVVIDDTNLSPRHLATITELVKGKAKVETKFFDITLNEAIKRDLARADSVGEAVIKDMYRQFILPNKFPRIEQDKTSSQPHAVIFDIDGTLAQMSGRSPYDMTRVSEDVPKESVCELATALEYYGFDIICFSGRDDSCRKETEQWLLNNRIKFKELHMRKQGDNRGDDIIKYELLQDVVKRYYIDFIVDDRPKVIRMWKAAGVNVLDVGNGIEF